MKKLFLLLVGIAFSVSCKNDDNRPDDCLSYSETFVTDVETVENGDAAGFLYKVDFWVMNGCGEFGSFEEIIEGNTITVKAVAKYKGCVCTESMKALDEVYSFNPPTPGTYTLRFRSSEDTFITETVTLE